MGPDQNIIIVCFDSYTGYRFHQKGTLLPLVSQASGETFADSLETVDSNPPPATNVPSLMIAETFGADEAMDVIQNIHMERGLELETLAREAKEEYESALADRGGD